MHANEDCCHLSVRRIGGGLIGGLRGVFWRIGQKVFLRPERALKHDPADLPGRLLTSPALADDVSSPSSSYPSAGCSSAEPASVSLDKIGV